MKNIITALLTAALVLMTSVVFSQQPQNPFEVDNAIINVSESPEKSITRYTVESAIRIKHRRVERKKEADALRLRERNTPPIERTDYDDIENRSFDNSICIPVVFNIIHDSAAYNTPHNPSDEDILVLLELLNEQFTEYVSNDATIPSSPETGISFALANDGTPATAIRRFDRYDPANDYIVNGEPNDDSDDWPDPIACGATLSSGFINVENFYSRIAFDPEKILNIYLLPSYSGITGFAWSPWSNNADFGVWLSSGSCNSNLGYVGPIGGYSPEANYAMLEEGMSSDYYAKFRKTISKSVGHYFGLLNTHTAPDPSVIQDVDWDWDTGTDCTATDDPWEAMVSLSYLDLYNPGIGPDGGWSQCEYHGDGCCDTPWSSSVYAPLSVGGDQCAHNDASLLVSNNSNPTECEEFFMVQHLQNEAMNRLNVMNLQIGFCDRYFFTDDQIARMHDMINVYRSEHIEAGSLLCLDDIQGDTVLGCMDFIACNYNADAEISDGSCYYDCCPQCTYDWNGDGVVNLVDLLQYLTVHGIDCSE